MDDTRLSTNVGTGDLIRTLDDGTRKYCVGVPAYVTTLGDPDVITIPVAAALADATANPTTLPQGSLVLLFNGTTWDRARGDTTNGLDVDVTRLPALVAGAATIGAVNLAQYTPSSGRLPIELDSAALAALETITVASVTAPLAAGDNNIGNVDVVTLPAITIAAAQTIAAVTAITDTVNIAASDSHDTAIGTKTFLIGAYASASAQASVTEGDLSRLWCDLAGRLQIGDGAGSLTVDSTDLTAIAASASVLDDWDETDRAKVNLIVGQAGIAAGAGAVGVTVPRVTLASDDPVVVAIQIMDDWDNAASDGASVSGDVAHDVADAGEPVKQGAKATTSIAGLTLVADADRTNLFAGIDGVQIVRTHCNLEDIVAGNASNTDGTSTQVIATAGAGIKQYLTQVTLTNTSATMIYVEMKSATTVRWTIPVPATGGAVVNFNPPLPPNAANEAWNFDPSAATSTVYCSALGFRSKV